MRNGGWTGRYLEDTRHPDGRIVRVHKRVYLGSLHDLPTKKAAIRKLEPMLSQINSQSYQPTNVITLSQFILRWEPLAFPQYKPGTQRNFKSALRSLVPVFGDRQLSDITSESIQRFISTVKSGPSHVRNLVKCLKAIWTSARTWNYVTHDPFAGLLFPKTTKSQRHHFSEEELGKILGAAKDDKTLYWILAQTGLRIGEALALRWEDINEDDRTLSVRGSVWRGTLQSAKTAAAIRSIPLSANLWNHLQAYRASWRSNDLQLLFSARNGKPLRADRILTDQLHPLLKSLNIKKTGYHAFRHANATLLDKMNVPMKVRQHRLGHANAKTTLQLYTHVIDASARDTADQFDTMFSTEAV